MKLLLYGLASAALLTITSTADAQFVQRGAQTGVIPRDQKKVMACWQDVKQLVAKWATPYASNQQQNRQVAQIGTALGCNEAPGSVGGR